MPKPPAPKPPKPPAPPAPKPTAAKPPTQPQTRGGGQPTSNQRPPKPNSNPGPGMHWAWKDNRWQAVRNTVSVNVTAPPGATGGQTTTGRGGGITLGGAPATQPQVDTGAPSGTDQYDTPASAADIEKQAQGDVAATDYQRSGQFTDLMGDLGFGLGSQSGSGYATFSDVFGTPGTSGDVNRFVMRDAMGREIKPENYESILGSDVYSPDGTTNIAGTALGNLIRQARQSGAEQAESRSASGISSGSGVARAQAEGRRLTGQEAFNDLIRRLRSGVSEIQAGRGQAYFDSIRRLGSSPGSVVKDKPTTPAAPTTTPTTSGAKSLSAGPKGEFRTQTDKIVSDKKLTPKQKIDALKKYLDPKKYTLTAAQSSRINQLIKNLGKK